LDRHSKPNQPESGSSIVDGIIVVDFAGVIVTSVRFVGGRQRPLEEACYRILASCQRARCLNARFELARILCARPRLKIRSRPASLRMNEHDETRRLSC